MIIPETLPDVSGKYKSELMATIAALDFSMRYRNMFFHVFYNYSGYYLVDYLGIRYSDEKVLATFYRGEKTL